MLVSFCIPAHNEERLLAATLAAIHEAARAAVASGAGGATGYEIVVGDDSSTDRTGEIAAADGARVVRVEARQIAKARNAAAKAAAGEWLVFVDADTIVNAAAVGETLAAFKEGYAAGGAGFRFDGALPLYARMLLPAFVFCFRVAKLTGGAYLFCTREALQAAGGWDETVFASEEVILAKAIKAWARKGRRRGFFVVRTPVLTSGRKLRTFSGREVLHMCVRAAWSRGALLRSREGLDIWYGPRTRGE